MKHRIYVGKARQELIWERNKKTLPRMWYGFCSCGEQWQFWFFGATLGFGLEHLRRSHGKTSSA